MSRVDKQRRKRVGGNQSFSLTTKATLRFGCCSLRELNANRWTMTNSRRESLHFLAGSRKWKQPTSRCSEDLLNSPLQSSAQHSHPFKMANKSIGSTSASMTIIRQQQQPRVESEEKTKTSRRAARKYQQVRGAITNSMLVSLLLLLLLSWQNLHSIAGAAGKYCADAD